MLDDFEARPRGSDPVPIVKLANYKVTAYQEQTTIGVFSDDLADPFGIEVELDTFNESESMIPPFLGGIIRLVDD